MSHAHGAVRFADGTILYYEYNGTSDIALPKLYDTPEEVSEHWRSDSEAECHCGQDEAVELMAEYGRGFAWDGRACRSCRAITAGFDPYDTGTKRPLPDWTPWPASLPT